MDSRTIYLPRSQDGAAQALSVEVRTASDPMRLTPAVTRVLSGVHRSVGLDFSTLRAQVTRSLQRERVLAILSTLFGSVALGLSMLGLYGVMAYTVARRRNEIGVRIALGADRSRVLRMVLADVSRVVILGLVLGAASAMASSKLVESFLYGVRPNDPAVMVLAAVLLAAVAHLAGVLPAVRACRLDPVAALRED
jgi:ABC-type antimicrobial peptide transport system permease subunit